MNNLVDLVVECMGFGLLAAIIVWCLYCLWEALTGRLPPPRPRRQGTARVTSSSRHRRSSASRKRRLAN